jgi:hypothetical protein
MDARKLKTMTARRYWPVAPEIHNINHHSTCFRNIPNNSISYIKGYNMALSLGTL